jgi:carbamoyl-phosphate synthase small subunit
MEGSDLVRSVTCGAPFDWAPEPTPAELRELTVAPERQARRRLKIAAYDFGMKWNILRRFTEYNCDVRVFPATTPARQVLESKPDGVFLSNGPGDPAALGYAIENVQTMLSARVPVFGICLGHQLLGLAYGARTFKLKFGHRGANHPVKQVETGQVEITSQNHGFAVDPATLPPDTMVTHTNLYDGTLEGFRHRRDPVFGVQYHPEASPGPHDADYLFRRFMDEIEGREAEGGRRE